MVAKRVGRKKRFWVKIRWGSESAQAEIYPDEKSGDCYSFKTEAELQAFLEGVDAASGYLDYDIVGPASLL